MPARDVIVDWAERGRIRPEDLPRALAMAGATPDGRAWRRFLSVLLLVTGSVLLAAGIVIFFAYNWDALGRYQKFALVEAALAAAAAAAWFIGPARIAGQAALLLAALLTGALLALVGQTYQTGADTYQLFGYWAVLILPWVVVGRMPLLWLLWLGLVNLTLALYFDAFQGVVGALIDSERLAWTAFALNTIALVAWEVVARRGVRWMSGRWTARVLAVASGWCAANLALWAVFETSGDIGPWALPAYLAWMAAAFHWYRYRIGDLFVLAGGVLSGVVVIAATLLRWLGNRDNAGVFLLIGLVVIGLSAAGAWWLRRIDVEVHE